jgi:hypothetical protein
MTDKPKPKPAPELLTHLPILRFAPPFAALESGAEPFHLVGRPPPPRSSG